MDLPNVRGFRTETLPVTAVVAGDYTQFQVRYPVTQCDDGTWRGKRWAGGRFHGDENCPQEAGASIDVTFCGPPE